MEKKFHIESDMSNDELLSKLDGIDGGGEREV